MFSCFSVIGYKPLAVAVVVGWLGHHIYKRYFETKCSWCNTGGHTMRSKIGDCPAFIAARKSLTTPNYYGQATIDIQNNFSAAGILLFYVKNDKTYILCIEETRGGKTLYNFPGGKRDEATEKYHQTALRELYEETGLTLTDVGDPTRHAESIIACLHPYKIIWNLPGKYVLMMVKIFHHHPETISLPNNVKWISVDNLNDGNLLHPFAQVMFDIAIKNQALHHY
jgi:8-oxo-dGTP pyrophosphatase MutT (NUDIX family)